MANRICTYCNKPVVLSPSAEQRAKKCGGTAEFYRSLFPNHPQCSIAAREAGTLELMRRLNQESRHAI